MLLLLEFPESLGLSVLPLPQLLQLLLLEFPESLGLSVTLVPLVTIDLCNSLVSIRNSVQT